ncbi:aldehyde dehydrogenase [Trametopsis cervina]|nr:aldehyde dehydrogenase [Trametopsis cervina]
MTSPLQYTSIEDLPAIHARLHKTFKSGITRSLAWRKHQLVQLARMFQENQEAIQRTLYLDLRKADQEVALSEILGVVGGCLHAIEHLDEWAAPTHPPVEPHLKTWNATVYKTPKGVACLISPWNYPWTLTFKPLTGAIAAGCAVVVKPSEATAHSAALMAELVPKYLDPNAYVVVNGAVPETTALLNLRWDHIFYTGGVTVGRIIAAAAAKFVTPTTLELGGKSPAYIGDDTDLDIAAKRLLHGKSQNAGQLCVSPDYTLVLRSVYPALLESLTRAYAAFFPEGFWHPSAKWPKAVNARHADRLLGLLRDTKGQVVLGGNHELSEEGTRIELTIVGDVKPDDVLMQDEIFGPIHPLLIVDTLDDAINLINSLPKPLVIYPFTNSEETKQRFLTETSSGSVTFNDTVSVLGTNALPFGGQGDSGYGSWHGVYTFNTFSHERVSLDAPLAEEKTYSARYRPYTQASLDAVQSLIARPLPQF